MNLYYYATPLLLCDFYLIKSQEFEVSAIFHRYMVQLFSFSCFLVHTGENVEF